MVFMSYKLLLIYYHKFHLLTIYYSEPLFAWKVKLKLLIKGGERKIRKSQFLSIIFTHFKKSFISVAATIEPPIIKIAHIISLIAIVSFNNKFPSTIAQAQ